ncbi:MAG: OmpH family outer membrane protein [Edaphocola sp.]
MNNLPNKLNRYFTASAFGLCLAAAGCGNGGNTPPTASGQKATTPAGQNEVAAGGSNGKIAYVDMDTLQAKYEYLKAKRDELEKRTAAIDAEIGKMGQTLQTKYAAFQKKAQAGTLSQAEGEAGQRELAQMQENIETRRQTLGNQLLKDQEAFNKDLQDRLDAFLEKYNADKKYDYILSYAKGGSILFANKALNITEDVVKGMNEAANGVK